MMFISVLYPDNTYDVVKSTRLENLIVLGKITKFFRSSGWVTISTDPIRKTNRGLSRGKCGKSQFMLA